MCAILDGGLVRECPSEVRGKLQFCLREEYPSLEYWARSVWLSRWMMRTFQLLKQSEGENGVFLTAHLLLTIFLPIYLLLLRPFALKGIPVLLAAWWFPPAPLQWSPLPPPPPALPHLPKQSFNLQFCQFLHACFFPSVASASAPALSLQLKLFFNTLISNSQDRILSAHTTLLPRNLCWW